MLEFLFIQDLDFPVLQDDRIILHELVQQLGGGLAGQAGQVGQLLVGQRFVDDGVRIVFDAADYPVGAVRFMQAEGTSGNLAVPLEWGGYTLWHTAPAIAVSLDGRFATVYPHPVVAANFAFFRGDPQDGTHLLDAYPTTLVLAPRGALVAVADRPDWHLRYRDEVADLYAAGPPRVAAAGQSPTGRLRFP